MRNVMRIFTVVFYLTLLVGCNKAGTIQDNFGNNYQLDKQNKKWVVLNIWATWCPPCLEEMPEFNQFHAKHQSKVITLGANFDNIRGDKLNKAIHRFQIRFPLLQGKYEEVFHLQSVSSVPTTFIFNPQGRLLKTLHGPQTHQSLEAEMNELGAKL